MIRTAALLFAALATSLPAQAQERCVGIAALTGADGRSLRTIGLQDSPGGLVAIFAGRRRTNIPLASHCSLEFEGDGARSLTCFYNADSFDAGARNLEASPEALFDTIVGTLRTCMRVPLVINTQREPYYEGATDIFALQQVEERRPVRGGFAEIRIILIEATGDSNEVYMTASFGFTREDN